MSYPADRRDSGGSPEVILLPDTPDPKRRSEAQPLPAQTGDRQQTAPYLATARVQMPELPKNGPSAGPAGVPVPTPGLPNRTNPAPSVRPGPSQSTFKKNSHVFNIPKAGTARPEHHNPLASRSSAHYGAAPVPISVPQPNRPQGSLAPARPLYSSLHQQNGAAVVVGPQRVGSGGSEVIDLTSDRPRERPSVVPKLVGTTHTTYASFFGQPEKPKTVTSEDATNEVKALLLGKFDDSDEEDAGERPKKAKPAPKRKSIKQKKQVERAPEDGSNEDAFSDNSLSSLPDPKLFSEKPREGGLGHYTDDTDEDEEEEGEEEEGEEEEEDGLHNGNVAGLAVRLLPHQVKGVRWMIGREIGDTKEGGILPKGGILADDMGLGKTIQTIALLLSNPRPPPRSAGTTERGLPKRSVVPSIYTKSTLIVAPLALIKQWESEIGEKVEKDHKLRVLVHHGPSRTKSPETLKRYDVVITTYQILSSEHAASGDLSKGNNVGCMGVDWYRVVLDEAHSIKNKSAKCSQAAYGLSSWYRWCLSGTPMQNNLDELQSLIRFLRVKPYSEFVNWKQHIIVPMKSGSAAEAIQRLQQFLKAIMKRRTKDVLRKDGALSFGKPGAAGGKKEAGFKIQPRTVELVTIDFNQRERRMYNSLSDRAQSRLDTMSKADYIGALVLLLRLRQACNHPQLVGHKIGSDGDALSMAGADRSKGAKSDDVDDVAALLGGLSVTRHKCDICQDELPPAVTEAGRVHCADCAADLADGMGMVWSKAKKPKPKPRTKAKTGTKSKTGSKPAGQPRRRQLVCDSDDSAGEGEEDAEGVGQWIGEEDSETGSEGDEEGSSRLGLFRDGRRRTPQHSSDGLSDASEVTDPESEPGKRPLVPSTKIRKLMEILDKEAGENKVIVFSVFTSMLDLVEPFLERAGHTFVRYDGRMRNDDREASLDALRHDPAVRVLLCSLKCGGLGLNLTAACRVVLLEPFWNPFAESQAIDRVHRLNQTKPVHVYRLTITDTVEERILRLQEAKQALADAALEGGKAQNKLSFNDILKLFRRNPRDEKEEAEGR